MSGVHHAYSKYGKQEPGLHWAIKRGPRKPHRHKRNHGYWELNPNSTDKANKYRWVHYEGYEEPYSRTPLSDRPLARVAQEIVRNAISGNNAMISPAPTTTVQQSSMMLPVLLLGALILMK